MLIKKLAWPYITSVNPVTLPVNICDVKDHLRLDPDEAHEDTYIRSLIETASLYCENYTGRLLTSRTVETYRDSLWDDLTIRRTPVQAITSIEYLKDNTLATVASGSYYLTISTGFPEIVLNDGESWPTDGDIREQSVKITFTAGYGITYEDVPETLKTGILHHVAYLYEDRGDSSPLKGLPNTTRIMYDNYRVLSI